MENLPADVKVSMSRDMPAAEDVILKRKRQMAILEEMLEDYRSILALVDRKDKHLAALGFPEPAAVNASGRRIKKPNKDFDIGGGTAMGGGKRKRKGAARGSQNDIRAAAIQKKYDKKKQELIEKVAAMLRNLSRHKDHKFKAQWFVVPVDRKLVPDYYNIVTSPMDLGTIVTRIKNQEYRSLRLLKSDIDLVWANCNLYNKEGPVREAGKYLSGVVNTQWKLQNVEKKWAELENMQALEIQRLTADEHVAEASDAESDEATEITPPERQRSKSSKKKKPRNTSNDLAYQKELEKQVKELRNLQKQNKSGSRKAEEGPRCDMTTKGASPTAFGTAQASLRLRVWVMHLSFACAF